MYFWSAGRTRSDEFELTDAADIHEVLDWIDANADGREVEALVVVDGSDVGRGAVLGSIGAARSRWVYDVSVATRRPLTDVRAPL